ncbi:copper chaperone PCu(A)C [Thermus sp. LT1-2-5]|uniref:copper chaperone PCu(A)C n=1 Tax=Thermus sp. LT1-2-5 TaxID=3026935 RepID=UPI003365A284
MRRGMAAFLPRLPQAQEVRMGEGWVRYPATLAVTAAHLTLENQGRTPLRWVGAGAAWMERMELHGTRQQEREGKRVMGTRPVDLAEVPVKGRLLLKPGGYYPMRFNPKRTMKWEEKVEWVLRFQGGLRSKVALPVEAR